MKQIKEPESSSNISLAGDRPIALPEYIRQARQNPADNSGPAFDWLAFFKKFNVRPKDLLKARKTRLKPAKVTRLASGLTIEKTLEIVDGLETALGEFKTGAAPYPSLNPTRIQVEQTATNLAITLPSSDNEIKKQRELTRLLYLLVTGQELAADFPAAQLDTLAVQYPHTVSVLRQGWQDGYSSTRQLGGAFGWSLFRWENLPLSDEQIEAARSRLAEKPKKERVARQLDLPIAEIQPTSRGGFPGALALGSLMIGLVLIVAFLVFSAANPPVTVQGKITHSPIATLIPSPTAPKGLQNTRQADGVNVTRLNPAYLTLGEQKYVSPDSLAPSQAVKLNSQRNIRAVSAAWSLGQNVYLTLQDGGWEVWDTVSSTRISRRELSDADQYAWISWSPDGENFAAEGLDGKMRLGTGGRVLRTFAYPWNGTYPGDSYFQISWSPDSSLLMLRSNDSNSKFQFWTFNGSPQLIQGPTDQPFLDLKSESGKTDLNEVIWSWSGDSRYIAFYLPYGFNLVNIYDSHTLERVSSLTTDWQIPLPSGAAFVDGYNSVSSQGNFSWSPDGKYMALQRWIKGTNTGDSPYKRVLLVWEVPSITGLCLDSCPVLPDTYQLINLDSPDSADLIAWSRNDRLLVDSRQVEIVNNGPVVKSNSLKVYDLGVGESFNWTNTFSFSLPEFPYDVRAWWSPDGRRILVNDDRGYLAIYEAPSQSNSVINMNVHVLSKTVDDQVDTAIPSPDGKWLATYSKVSGPQLRDLKTGQIDINFYYPVSNGTISYKWSPDSQYLAAIYSWMDGTSYNLHTKTVAHVWKFDRNGIPPAVFGEIPIPTKADFVPRVEWNAKSAEPELLFEQDQNNVGVLKVTKNFTGTISIGTASATPGSSPVSVTPNATTGDSMVYVGSMNGQAPPPLVVTSGNVKILFNTDSTPTPIVTVSTTPVQAVSPTPNQVSQQVGSLSARSNIPQFWTVPRAWSSDWSFLVGPLDNVRDYGILKLAPVDSKEPPQKIIFQPSTEEKPEKANVTAAVVSPDGRMVALGFDNGLVQLYNAANGKLFQAYNAHQAAVTVLSFSPDSKNLASGSSDHTVKVWETTGWKNTAMLRAQIRAVTFLQWLPDSKTLISSGSDANSAVMWRIS